MHTGLNEIVLTSFRRDDVASLSKRRHCYVPAGTLPALHWHYKVFFSNYRGVGEAGGGVDARCPLHIPRFMI